MLSPRADNVWLAVGILSIAGFIYVGAEHLLIARMRAEAKAIKAQAQTLAYSNALAACRDAKTK